MTPSIPQDEFALMARRTGIPLTDAQIATLYEAYGWMEAQQATLRGPRDRSAEPALIFQPELRA